MAIAIVGNGTRKEFQTDDIRDGARMAFEEARDVKKCFDTFDAQGRVIGKATPKGFIYSPWVEGKLK